MPTSSGKRVAVIGAGWAGCAAAVRLAQDGFTVTLIEASRTLGGRARRVDLHEQALDNGQHILLGAYRETLDLMKMLGIDAAQACLTLPLQMIYPSITDGMRFLTSKLPAPLHLLHALLRAKGLNMADRMALARFSSTARWMDWQLHQDCSVTELLLRFDQTERLCRLMWYPLCLAALNTPPERASANVFLNVLRDSLGAKRAASDMLLPRHDLSTLLPEAASKYLQQHGGQVILATRVNQIQASANGQWQLMDANRPEQALGEWHAVVIATPLEQTKRLLQSIGFPPEQLTTKQTHSAPHVLENVLKQLDAFEHEAITTCYLQYPTSVKLERPFFALLDQPDQQRWAQFVFDRGQLNPQQAGLMAVVISASGTLPTLTPDELAQAIAQQLAQQLNDVRFAQPIWYQIITEKRATFACTPNLQRPNNDIGIPNLWLAGDYTASDYPATLEAAVRSGLKAAQELSLICTNE